MFAGLRNLGTISIIITQTAPREMGNLLKMVLSRDNNKDSFSCNLNAFIYSCSNATCYGQTHFFEKAFEHLGIKLLVNFDNFSVLLIESNAFKFQLKESFLISRDQMIFDKDKFSLSMKLFD